MRENKRRLLCATMLCCCAGCYVACVGNRAFAQLKAENYGSAIVDADAALAIDPTFVKAYYRCVHAVAGTHCCMHNQLEPFRTKASESMALHCCAATGPYAILPCSRGSAHLALGKHKAARADFRGVIKLKPSDPDAQVRDRYLCWLVSSSPANWMHLRIAGCSQAILRMGGK